MLGPEKNIILRKKYVPGGGVGSLSGSGGEGGEGVVALEVPDQELGLEASIKLVAMQRGVETVRLVVKAVFGNISSL